MARTGLLLSALPLGFGLAALFGDLVLPRTWGDRRRGLAGALLACAVMCAAAFVPVTLVTVVPLLALAGLGLGIFVPANNTVIMRSTAPHPLAAGCPRYGGRLRRPDVDRHLIHYGSRAGARGLGSATGWSTAADSLSRVPPGCGPVRLSLLGHQFHRPSKTTVHGTRTVRTIKVSISTPRARPTPTSTIWLPPEPRPPTTANTEKVPASTSPAEVTVVPVAASARLTASRSGRWRASSLILLITRML